MYKLCGVVGCGMVVLQWHDSLYKKTHYTLLHVYNILYLIKYMMGPICLETKPRIGYDS